MYLSEENKFLILVSNDTAKNADCLVLLEGDGYNRIDEVVNLYKLGYSKKIIFSGGYENKKSGAFSAKFIYPELLKKGIPKDDILLEENSLNTFEQAVEVVKILKNNNWLKIILVASHYHQYRAFLTFLKVLIDEKLDSRIKIFNSAAKKISWYESEEWGSRIELLSDEFEKITSYGAKGNVASFTQAISYLKWRDTSPM